MCSSQFFVDLLTGIELANDPSQAKKVSKVLPMLIISGAEDPVGSYGKGIRRIEKLYKDAGLYDVRVKLFDKDRHEILNELDKSDVYSYIGSYLVQIAGSFAGDE